MNWNNWNTPIKMSAGIFRLTSRAFWRDSRTALFISSLSAARGISIKRS